MINAWKFMVAMCCLCFLTAFGCSDDPKNSDGENGSDSGTQNPTDGEDQDNQNDAECGEVVDYAQPDVIRLPADIIVVVDNSASMKLKPILCKRT